MPENEPLLQDLKLIRRLRCLLLGHRLGFVRANPERECIDCGKRL